MSGANRPVDEVVAKMLGYARGVREIIQSVPPEECRTAKQIDTLCNDVICLGRSLLKCRADRLRLLRKIERAKGEVNRGPEEWEDIPTKILLRHGMNENTFSRLTRFGLQFATIGAIQRYRDCHSLLQIRGIGTKCKVNIEISLESFWHNRDAVPLQAEASK